MDFLDKDWGWLADILELVVAIVLAIWINSVTGSRLGWVVFWGYIIIGAVVELALERHPLWLMAWPIALPIYARYDILESLVTIWLHLRALFTGRSVEEEVLERRGRKVKEEEKRERRERVEHQQGEIRRVEERLRSAQEDLERIRRAFPETLDEVPEVLEYLSEDLRHRGYWEEITERIRWGQLRKRAEKQKEAYAEARRLVNEIANLRRAKAGLSRATYESEEEEGKLRVKKKRMREGEVKELAGLEMDIEKLRLQREKAELEAELRKVRGEAEPEPPKLEKSPEEAREDFETNWKEMADAVFHAAVLEGSGVAKLRKRVRDEILKNLLGDTYDGRDYEELAESEKREVDEALLYADRMIDEEFGGVR